MTASTQEAADAGVEILRAGGNAVDAAVAAALATSVADPCNVGIGGYGGFMVVHHPAWPGARCVQFPLCAPLDLPREGLARAYPEEGPECSSMPGVVAGLAAALRDFGTFDWARVSAPAIRLCRGGVAATDLVRRAFEQNRHRGVIGECFEVEPDAARGFVFRQEALASTLERLAEKGPEWFYEGPLGDAACRAWRAGGVEVAPDEWRGHPQTVEVLDAPHYDAGDVRLFAPALELTGSPCVFATFEAAVRLGPASLARDDGMAELAVAMAGIWQHRFAGAGGNDFAAIDLRSWVEAALARREDAGAPAREVGHTAHLNAADASGMIAALSATQGHAWFGGRWAIPGTGVIMNAGMHGFTQGATARRGARTIGVSNMSPTIARARGGERVALGCPGARRIPSNVGLVLARHFLCGAPLQPAVSAGRFHAEERHRARYEAGRAPQGFVDALRRRFPAVEPQPADDYYGPLSALRVSDAGAVEAAVDDREARASHAFA
ncbi:MAG TPA: gamma-glutamyltransferase [Gemmatimonadales bacterium]|nr:gamma-glutamyltransferase [Gemmatimonadales bacterium]